MSIAPALLAALCCMAATATGGSAAVGGGGSPPPKKHTYGSMALSLGRPYSKHSSSGRSHWWPVWCIVSVVIIVLVVLVIGLVAFCVLRRVKRIRAERASERRSKRTRWLGDEPDELTAREYVAPTTASPVPHVDLLMRPRSAAQHERSDMSDTQIYQSLADFDGPDENSPHRRHREQQRRRNMLVSTQQRAPYYDATLVSTTATAPPADTWPVSRRRAPPPSLVTTATAAPGASTGSLVASAASRAHSDMAVTQTRTEQDMTRSASVTVSQRSLSLGDISVDKDNAEGV